MHYRMRLIVAAFAGLVSVFVLLLAFPSHIVRNDAPTRAKRIAEPKTFTPEEAREIWARMRPPYDTIDVREVSAGNTVRILVDVNDDGIIDEQDSIARTRGAAEIVRLDDALCNGRSGVYDRTAALDDDLQLVTIQLPTATLAADELRLVPAGAETGNLAFYTSDWITPETEARWPIRVDSLPFRDDANHRVFVWMKITDLFGGASHDGAVSLALERDGQILSSDTLHITVVGKLGDPNYFAGALDYLMERDRRSGRPSRFFLDEIQCASNNGMVEGVETFRLVMMRYALTEMNVLETYYANNDPKRGRIKSILDAMDRNPGQDLIVNGSFFMLENHAENHGKRVLGAVVNDYKMSPASGPHQWQKAYQESGVPGTPEWQYKSFCLHQPKPGPGLMALVEEPFSPQTPFVPAVTRDGAPSLPFMALGGLHQVHNFQNNPGCNIACMGFVDVPDGVGQSDNKDRRLIWIAATDTDRKKTTSRYGHEAFRQALRKSGLTIDEGDPQRGAGPGRCDFVYFDSANSVALSYKVDDAFETPVVSARHLQDSAPTFVNNYLMLKVAEAP